MKLEHVPLLHTQRRLYDLPRDFTRFQGYLDAMTGGTQDIILPLARMNPMGKEHVAATLDALLAIDAEAAAAAAVDTADRRLAALEGELKIGLVVADDAGGGWTNRYLTETAQRFDNEAEAKRGWAVALLWTSEQPMRERVREEVLAALYRTLYLQRRGPPKTLRQMLDQEGLASAFAAVPPPPLDPERMGAIRDTIRPHLASTAFPIQFACLYGDEAASSVGYPALGLPFRAGYALALDEAARRPERPEAILIQSQPH